MLPVSNVTGRIGDKKVKTINTAKGESVVVSLMLLVPYYNEKVKEEDTAVFWLDWYGERANKFEKFLDKGDLISAQFTIVHKTHKKDGKTQHFYQNRVEELHKFSNGRSRKDDVTTDELESAYSITSFDTQDTVSDEDEPF